ncbi:hypothetical protein ANN_03459 [Periplaneta americana]|uniref:Uncharacterized protein n=1 Tax=Periplaneta americana TaxID=6978 RepID=A0ABQ8TZ64_PERAM|nr:hypothetical protein ANN_03459 [Periplaneta americana]
MAGLCEGGNEPPGSLKASNHETGVVFGFFRLRYLVDGIGPGSLRRCERMAYCLSASSETAAGMQRRTDKDLMTGVCVRVRVAEFEKKMGLSGSLYCVDNCENIFMIIWKTMLLQFDVQFSDFQNLKIQLKLFNNPMNFYFSEQ